MAKKVQTHVGGKKACHQGPIAKNGSGVGGSTIPRTGHVKGGMSSRRIDASKDSHSVDKGY